MLKLDNDLLQELGLGSLPDDQKQAMLQYIYEILELRVGTNLANQMSDDQLDEFEKFIDDKGEANQAQALQWLEANLPNYKQVVNEVFEQLKIEIRQMAPQLLASSNPGQLGQPPAAPATFAPPSAQAVPAQGGYGPQSFSQAAAAPHYTGAQSQFYGQQPPAPQPAYQPAVGSQAQDPQASFQSAAPYDPVASAGQPSLQQGAGFGQPLQQQPPVSSTPPISQSQHQTDQAYQLPTQQPPAGPGSYPPQHQN